MSQPKSGLFRPQTEKTGRSVYFVTVYYESGEMRMWTSLLRTDGARSLQNEAIARFRGFAGKHLRNTEAKEVSTVPPRPALVKAFPGRFDRNKDVTDVLVILNNKPGERQGFGKVFVWGLPPGQKFQLLEGPITVDSKTNPEFFPRLSKRNSSS